MKQVSLNTLLERIQRRYLVRALEASNFNQAKAAILLDLPRSTFIMKCRRYKIDPKQLKAPFSSEEVEPCVS